MNVVIVLSLSWEWDFISSRWCLCKYYSTCSITLD